MSQFYEEEAALPNRQSYARKPGQQRQRNEATNIPIWITVVFLNQNILLCRK